MIKKFMILMFCFTSAFVMAVENPDGTNPSTGVKPTNEKCPPNGDIDDTTAKLPGINGITTPSEGNAYPV